MNWNGIGKTCGARHIRPSFARFPTGFRPTETGGGGFVIATPLFDAAAPSAADRRDPLGSFDRPAVVVLVARLVDRGYEVVKADPGACPRSAIALLGGDEAPPTRETEPFGRVLARPHGVAQTPAPDVRVDRVREIQRADDGNVRLGAVVQPECDLVVVDVAELSGELVG